MTKPTSENDTIDKIFAPLTDHGDHDSNPPRPESPLVAPDDSTSQLSDEPPPDLDADQFLHTQRSLVSASLGRESVNKKMISRM
mmetsp:Transcript_38896/g.39580  ORF Transcript_38896/g.39580 Transcript_38896/m.39580 type:complete len:84 (-) Transcript_38896:633-884(-)